jgi:hypothetical protein
MVSPHRIHGILFDTGKVMPDPGDGGTIRPNQDLQTCQMVTGASGETRILADPTKPGIRFRLRLMTDGGGDAVVTAAAGYNVGGNTVATFADASDILSLISVSITATTYRWEILEGNLATPIS